MDFIEELKKDHLAILDYFRRIDATVDFEAKKILLQEMKVLAVAHLQKEDSILYPACANSSNQEVSRMAEIFTDTKKECVELFLQVTDEYAVSKVDTNELELDYKKLRDKIINRVNLEELMLYPGYLLTVAETN